MGTNTNQANDGTQFNTGTVELQVAPGGGCFTVSAVNDDGMSYFLSHETNRKTALTLAALVTNVSRAAHNGGCETVNADWFKFVWTAAEGARTWNSLKDHFGF